MSIWVKICGNTSLEDARLAADAGADAVGFVFAPSPRRVSVGQVERIAPQLPTEIEKIGVFVDAALDEIVAAVRRCGLTGVQLHWKFGAELPARLRAELGRDLRILCVVHFGDGAAERAEPFALDANVDAVLVDSRTATAEGGTGVAFDWDEARRTVFGGACKAKLIAAGGLSPANVAEAIAKLQPWGVDVASGVEASPGRKDSIKVRAFVTNSRKAQYK
jgi:phosphoribosylanthranilate isomerase